MIARDLELLSPTDTFQCSACSWKPLTLLSVPPWNTLLGLQRSTLPSVSSYLSTPCQDFLGIFPGLSSSSSSFDPVNSHWAISSTIVVSKPSWGHFLCLMPSAPWTSRTPQVHPSQMNVTSSTSSLKDDMVPQFIFLPRLDSWESFLTSPFPSSHLIHHQHLHIISPKRLISRAITLAHASARLTRTPATGLWASLFTLCLPQSIPHPTPRSERASSSLTSPWDNGRAPHKAYRSFRTWPSPVL